MSTKREPLLSDADISKMSVTENGLAGENKYRMGRRIRDIYEAARAKDAELIQRLVDALHIATRYNHYKTVPEEWHNSIKIWNRAMEDADAAGFKPTEQ